MTKRMCHDDVVLAVRRMIDESGTDAFVAAGALRELACEFDPDGEDFADGEPEDTE